MDVRTRHREQSKLLWYRGLNASASCMMRRGGQELPRGGRRERPRFKEQTQRSTYRQRHKVIWRPALATCRKALRLHHVRGGVRLKAMTRSGELYLQKTNVKARNPRQEMMMKVRCKRVVEENRLAYALLCELRISGKLPEVLLSCVALWVRSESALVTCQGDERSLTHWSIDAQIIAGHGSIPGTAASYDRSTSTAST